MNIFHKTAVLALFLLVVAACKEVQLYGPIISSDIFIDLLNQPGINPQTTETSTSGDTIDEVGLSAWIELSNPEKFLRVGNFEVKDSKIDPDALYLVDARGGNDVDADRNGGYDVVSTDVDGSWRAIMSGEELTGNGNLVSALTEAAYLYVYRDIGLGTDEDLRARLDEFAQMVISDVNKDGVVNYTDVLKWTRLYSEGQYLGDINFLYALIDTIVSDAPDFIRYAAAQSVWSNSPVEPVDPEDIEPTLIPGSTGQGDVFWTRDESPYELDTNLNINGDLHIEGGVEIIGNNHVVAVFGDLIIDGLPRNPARLEALNLVLSNFPTSAQSSIRFADFERGSINVKTRRFVMEYSRARRLALDIKSITNSNDHSAIIRQNIFEKSEILFNNRSPARLDYEVDFSNNLIIPPDSSESILTTEWEGLKGNLSVKNNTFPPNMRILRGEGDPVLDLRDNYWGVEDVDDADFNEIIPNNPVVNGEFEHIFFKPILRDEHPDTPQVRE